MEGAKLVTECFKRMIDKDPTEIEVYDCECIEEELQKEFKLFYETNNCNLSLEIKTLFQAVVNSEEYQEQPFMVLFYTRETDYIFGVMCMTVRDLSSSFHWFQTKIKGYQKVLAELLREEAGKLAVLVYMGDDFLI